LVAGTAGLVATVPMNENNPYAINGPRRAPMPRMRPAPALTNAWVVPVWAEFANRETDRASRIAMGTFANRTENMAVAHLRNQVRVGAMTRPANANGLSAYRTTAAAMQNSRTKNTDVRPNSSSAAISGAISPRPS
jgi:hypothetical protein